jgi:putative DNA-invertase from lambdoid prophage Rac
MFLTVAAAFAEAERDRIRERVLQTCEDLKRQGKRTGGPVPFGYVSKDAPDGRGSVLVEDPVEQRFVRRVLAPLRGRGMSYRDLSAVARKHGYELGRVAVANVLRRMEEAK